MGEGRDGVLETGEPGLDWEDDSSNTTLDYFERLAACVVSFPCPIDFI